MTVFERDERAGGLLRFGIPDYKLEKAVVDRRIEQMRGRGHPLRAGLRGRPRPARRVRRGRAGDRRPAPPRARPARSRAGRRGAGPALPGRVQPGRGRAEPRRPRPDVRGRRVVVLGAATPAPTASATACATARPAYRGRPRRAAAGRRAPLRTWPQWPRVLRHHPVHEEGGSREWRFETARFVGEGGRLTGLADGDGRVLEADVALLAIGFAGVEPGRRWRRTGRPCRRGERSIRTRRPACSRPATACSAPT